MGSKGKMYWCFWPVDSRLIAGTAHVGDAMNHEPSGATFPDTCAGFKAAEDYVLDRNREIFATRSAQ